LLYETINQRRNTIAMTKITKGYEISEETTDMEYEEPTIFSFVAIVHELAEVGSSPRLQRDALSLVHNSAISGEILATSCKR